jgi:hypothetical protein
MNGFGTSAFFALGLGFLSPGHAVFDRAAVEVGILPVEAASTLTTQATAAYSTWVAPAATARLRFTTQATPASSTWTAPAATAQTRYTISASAASSSWVAPSASAQMARRRAISVLCSVSGYSIGLSAPAIADIPCSSSSYQIEVS